MGAAIIDIGPNVVSLPSIQTAGLVSGLLPGLSGTVIGTSVDLLNANGMCNVYVAGRGVLLSGNLRLQVQQSDSDTSGTFTDPTAGILSGDLTNVFSSGGIMTLNPNNSGGVLSGGFTSGQSFLSGFMAIGAFQRGGRFVRLNVLGDSAIVDIQAGFISAQKVVNPTGGFSQSPAWSGSNVVNV